MNKVIVIFNKHKMGLSMPALCTLLVRNCVHFQMGSNEMKKENCIEDIFVLCFQNTREKWKMKRIHMKKKQI